MHFSMGTVEGGNNGYSKKVLDTWAKRAFAWQLDKWSGLEELVPNTKGRKGRDVFLYAISDCNERNPAAAIELIERVVSAE